MSNSYSGVTGENILVLIQIGEGKLSINKQLSSRGVCVENFLLLSVSWIMHENSENGFVLKENYQTVS